MSCVSRTRKTQQVQNNYPEMAAVLCCKLLLCYDTATIGDQHGRRSCRLVPAGNESHPTMSTFGVWFCPTLAPSQLRLGLYRSTLYSKNSETGGRIAVIRYQVPASTGCRSHQVTVTNPGRPAAIKKNPQNKTQRRF